ncbi:MAG TPA: hypothetical protein PLN38_17955, partial [Chitinophagales bacterium]|nr:hypothetical protein [Chitinophagales bacterium]
MAKSKKLIENTEEQSSENILADKPVEEVLQNELSENIEESKPIYIPDIPAQIIDQPTDTKFETEVDFLIRILQIQEEGGFGRHLNKIIHD